MSSITSINQLIQQTNLHIQALQEQEVENVGNPTVQNQLTNEIMTDEEFLQSLISEENTMKQMQQNMQNAGDPSQASEATKQVTDNTNPNV